MKMECCTAMDFLYFTSCCCWCKLSRLYRIGMACLNLLHKPCWGAVCKSTHCRGWRPRCPGLSAGERWCHVARRGRMALGNAAILRDFFLSCQKETPQTPKRKPLWCCWVRKGASYLGTLLTFGWSSLNFYLVSPSPAAVSLRGR